MSESEKTPTQLLMRADLANLPELNLPSNITIRSFKDGDEEIWNDIASQSFESKQDFNELMRKDPVYKGENVLIAEVDGVPAATASAWHREQFGKDTGYLHMVGALPNYRGLKLGYLVSLAAMYKLKENGFSSVVLHTDDFRLAAVKTYVHLGFEIDLSIHESMPERWAKIAALLGI